MTNRLLTFGPLPSAPTDLADWLDVRLILAGRLTLANIPLRRDRAELASVLGRAQQPRVGRRSDGRQDINVR